PAPVIPPPMTSTSNRSSAIRVRLAARVCSENVSTRRYYSPLEFLQSTRFPCKPALALMRMRTHTELIGVSGWRGPDWDVYRHCRLPVGFSLKPGLDRHPRCCAR